MNCICIDLFNICEIVIFRLINEPGKAIQGS